MIILILAATEINRDVLEISQKWGNIAEKPISKEVKAFIDELNMNTDCCHSATKTFTRNPLTDESYEKETHTESTIAGTSSSDDAQAPITIFMSYSLPKAVWQSLWTEAKKLKQPIQFVLRGLPSNSFQELAKKVMDYGCQVSIDPPLFEKYSITAVPAFLVKESWQNSDKGDHNHAYALEKGRKPGHETIFFGNVSLSFVMTKQAKNTAKESTHNEPPHRTVRVTQSPKETRL